jgi:hypothetical protein
MPAVNGVGEPCAGEPHARFEVAGTGNGADLAKVTGVAQRTGKPAATKAPGPKASEPPRQSPTLQRLYVIILYGCWTRAEARCRRPAGPGAAVLADGLPAGFPGPRLRGAGDLLLQLLEEPD